MTLTLSRTGDLSEDLVVILSISPTGALETQLTGSGGEPAVPIPAGRSDVTVELEPAGFNPGGDYLVTMVGGTGYEVGAPASTTVHVEELDDDPGCGPPSFTAAPSNTTQSVALGGALAPLAVVPYPGTTPYFALDDGSLPPGVELQPDGTFTGIATQEGTFVAIIGACTPAFVADVPPSEMPGTCALTRLTVVVGDGGPALPVTGSRDAALALAGGALVLAGAALQVLASRWERTEAQLLR